MHTFFKNLSVAFFLVSALNVLGQDTYPLITNVPNRDAMRLDGKWRYIVDPMENGYYDYRYNVNPHGFFKNTKPNSPSDLVEYSFDNADQINVPGDWNTQEEDLFFYEGTIWYKKSFTYQKNGKRAFLYFGAANYDAKVYLNGEKLGEHQGGFTPFNFEVTDLLKDGENFVILKVDNTRKKEQIPTVNSDWYNFGGITRSVKLLELPQTFIRDYYVQLKKGSQNEVEGWVQLDGSQFNEVTISIPEANVKVTSVPDENGRAAFSFKKKLELWSDTDPRLYTVKISSGAHHTTDQIGFRSIETDGNDILLNGKPIFLKGISIHEVVHCGKSNRS